MTNSSIETSAEIVVSSVDLPTEILLRLPIQTLFCFKQVSKHWQSLISDPEFVIRRNPIPNPAVGLFIPRQFPDGYAHVSFSNKETTRRRMRFNNPELAHGFKIIQSCNGLLLCYNFDLNYFVYNPTTGQSSPTIVERRDGIELSLAFDPAKSPHYKVVCAQFLFEYSDNESEYEFEVYSSETGVWRKCTRSLVGRIKFDNGVYWNGAIHWLDQTTGGCLYFNPDHVDDVDGSGMMSMMTPCIPKLMVKLFYFGESCGHLCYMGFCRMCDCVCVYELRTDYSEWFVKYEINLSPVYQALYDLSGGDEGGWDMLWLPAFTSTTLVRGERDKDSFLVVMLSPKVVVKYYFVLGILKTVCDFEDDGEVVNFAVLERCFPYIETLCFT